MKPFVIGFSGSIGSGKSTISTAVASALAWKRVSFGDYVRSVVKNKGLDESREILQETGALLISQGWEPFCRSVLDEVDWRPGQPLIVDGIRHSECLEVLRTIVAPVDLLLIFIATNEHTRVDRLILRDLTNMNNIKRMDKHSTEIQVPLLREISDLVVGGSSSIEDIVTQILLWLKIRDGSFR